MLIDLKSLITLRSIFDTILLSGKLTWGEFLLFYYTFFLTLYRILFVEINIIMIL